jgi:hypothetical protein
VSKSNQPQLSGAVGAIVSRDAPADTASSYNKGRSRQKDRTVEVFPVGDDLAHTEWAPCIKTEIPSPVAPGYAALPLACGISAVRWPFMSHPPKVFRPAHGPTSFAAIGA